MELTDAIKNKDFDGILNKQLWTRSTEYTALATLKFCFPVEFKNLKHSESPDLQDLVNMYAVEVTEATSEIEARTIGNWLRLNQPESSPEEKERRRSNISSNGYDLKQDGMLLHPLREISDEQRVLTQALSNKLNKVTSYKMKGFISIDLFIDYEKPFISDDPKEVFDWMKSTSKESEQRFNRVFIRYVGGLLILDFKKNKMSCIEISHEDRHALGNLGRMAAEGEIKDDDPIWD